MKYSIDTTLFNSRFENIDNTLLCLQSETIEFKQYFPELKEREVTFAQNPFSNALEAGLNFI